MALSSDFAPQRSRAAAADPFPAGDGASFADLTSATGVPLDRALRDGVANARARVTDLREDQFGPITGTKSLRLDFTGAWRGRPGSGAVHVREFDSVVCTITLFVAHGSGIAYDATLQRAISSLQPLKR